MMTHSADFWFGLLEVIWVNVLLSGDNAVVIALAARNLPPARQRLAVGGGASVAVLLRIVLTLLAARLLLLPWLKIVGAVLLVFIGVGLLAPAKPVTRPRNRRSGVGVAVRAIVIADVIMSLDNVVAVAAAAQGSLTLLIIGLALSIPLVVFGSTLLLKVIERFPAIVWLGAALLGFIAGQMLVGDPAVTPLMTRIDRAASLASDVLPLFAGILGALIVLGLGRLRLSRARDS
ncbi:MAG TPA: YjbE family putative metal transport protein [Burkholderiaceae bacterium]|nr:YjbE family putative metal transport protein [Burkholderiaceae bacterium]